ncbi:biofilm peroxide resistance protein BsmA [Candidatus Pantoea soli]|uniref:Biofilm peroxide resistance protein BsmA n=1 Tax=Candidatus Pantoea soli TaxID=3098669 RepID=A0A518XG62_9GAMM|nr:biofilm peroxide resistance protein BsmA [Pantoea soli]QDY43157.1 biofilm peroxide resistance protein BsmA [Pantoea soli]
MRSLLLILSLLLSGCAALHTTPQPPPPPAQQAQEITRAQSAGLPKLGNVTATSRGSPDDVQRAIAARASQAGAVYYQIVMLDDTTLPGQWYATAILYGAPLGRAGTQQ